MNAFARMRYELGLNVSEVAERIGCSSPVVHNLEQGKTRKPEPKIVRGLAELYEVDVAHVLRLAEEANDTYRAELDAARAVTA